VTGKRSGKATCLTATLQRRDAGKESGLQSWERVEERCVAKKKRRKAGFSLSKERWPSKKDRVQARITSCDIGAIDQARYEAKVWTVSLVKRTIQQKMHWYYETLYDYAAVKANPGVERWGKRLHWQVKLRWFDSFDEPECKDNYMGKMAVEASFFIKWGLYNSNFTADEANL